MMVDRFANGDSSNDAPLNRPDVLPLGGLHGRGRGRHHPSGGVGLL